MQNNRARARPTTPAGGAPEKTPPRQAGVAGQHRRVALENKLDDVSRWWRSSTGSARPRSDRELAATLATARGQDGAAGAGTHPQSKAMGPVPAAVVRLERALAHGSSPVCAMVCEVWGSTGVSAGTAHP